MPFNHTLSKDVPSSTSANLTMEAPCLKPDVNQEIRSKLREISGEESVLVVGYSPTGGGHTARTLNIVREAAEKELVKGSTVILHVPSKWDGAERPRDVAELVVDLQEKGINVVVAEARKSVEGFLIESTGGSDDARLLACAGEHARRQPAAIRHLARANLYLPETNIQNDKDERTKLVDKVHKELQEVPSLEAKDLMISLRRTIGDENMKKKVRILTDMDPTLQKAARQIGVPNEKRLEQTNHFIMLESGNNFDKKNALLAKVLGGNGEGIAPLEFGKLNPFPELKGIIDKSLKVKGGDIDKETKKIDVMHAFAKHALDNGVDLSRDENLSKNQGVLCGVKTMEEVKNVIYVYAHSKQKPIVDHIKEKVAKGEGGYKDTLFVFCGSKAMPGTNALKLAYAADADGITTMGAGTNGEHAYMHVKCGSGAKLLMLPIEGHNEQEKNSEYLLKNYKDAVVALTKPAPGQEDTQQELQMKDIDDYVAERYKAAPEKYAESKTMEGLLTGLEAESYVTAAKKSLFETMEEITEEKKEYNTKREKVKKDITEMHDNASLKANRKFLKIMTQTFTNIKACIDKGENPRDAAMSIHLGQDEEAFGAGIKDLSANLENVEWLKRVMITEYSIKDRTQWKDLDSEDKFQDDLKQVDAHVLDQGKNGTVEIKAEHVIKENFTRMDEFKQLLGKVLADPNDIGIIKSDMEILERKIKEDKTQVSKKTFYSDLKKEETDLGHNVTSGF